MISHAAAEDLFDPGRSLPPHDDGFVMSAACLFENISGDIVFMTILHRHVAHVEPGLCQRLAGLLQDIALGFPFLPNPGFLLIAQLHAQLRLGGRILRSAMLQQPPRHRLEHMKEGNDDIRCSTQERSNILDNAMGVFGLIDGQKNSHRGRHDHPPLQFETWARLEFWSHCISSHTIPLVAAVRELPLPLGIDILFLGPSNWWPGMNLLAETTDAKHNWFTHPYPNCRITNHTITPNDRSP